MFDEMKLMLPLIIISALLYLLWSRVILAKLHGISLIITITVKQSTQNFLAKIQLPVVQCVRWLCVYVLSLPVNACNDRSCDLWSHWQQLLMPCPQPALMRTFIDEWIPTTCKRKTRSSKHVNVTDHNYRGAPLPGCSKRHPRDWGFWWEARLFREEASPPSTPPPLPQH